jgi:hypothetical protein
VVLFLSKTGKNAIIIQTSKKFIMTKHNKLFLLTVIVIVVSAGTGILLVPDFWIKGRLPGKTFIDQLVLREAEDFELPAIAYCGTEEPINENQIMKIYYFEEDLCNILGGEVFASSTEARKKYGVKVDFKQEPNVHDPKVTFHTAYPGQTVVLGDNSIEVNKVSEGQAEFTVNGESKTVQSDTKVKFNNLELDVGYCCGETYRADFSVSEFPCCPEPEEGKVLGEFEEIEPAPADYVEDEGVMIRRRDEETERDLALNKRAGYRGVILPRNLARDYPSIDFALMPLIAQPGTLCCGCMQTYENLQYWGDYFTRQLRIALTNQISRINREAGSFAMGVVDRSEAGMRSALNEINLIKQNRDYFNPDMIIPKGQWINPDYVIEGGIEFSCCAPNTTLLTLTFTVEFIDATKEDKTVVHRLSYTPPRCFDLMTYPGYAMQVIDDYAREVAVEMERHFKK